MRYRGSLKHKSWRPGGGFGTLCPEWTHRVDGQGFAGDIDRHPWARTRAHELLDDSICGGDGRRYATGRGIAMRDALVDSFGGQDASELALQLNESALIEHLRNLDVIDDADRVRLRHGVWESRRRPPASLQVPRSS